MVVRRVTSRVLATLALIGLETLLLLGVWLVCLLIVFGFGAWWLHHGTFGFDAAAFRAADTLRARLPLLTPVVVGITWLGTQFALVPGGLLLLAYFGFVRRHSWHSWRVPVVALGAIGLNAFLKLTYHRPRPLLPHLVPAHGNSFPSGHAMEAVAFYGLLWWLARRHLRPGAGRAVLLVVLPALAILIGLSRIYLHVHYASDVVAGWAAGLAWLLLALRVVGLLEKRATRAAPDLATAEEEAADLDQIDAPAQPF